MKHQFNYTNLADSDLVPLNLRYLVAQLSSTFENLFSYDSEYKNQLHKYGINLGKTGHFSNTILQHKFASGELRNSVKDFEENVGAFYESDLVKR